MVVSFTWFDCDKQHILKRLSPQSIHCIHLSIALPYLKIGFLIIKPSGHEKLSVPNRFFYPDCTVRGLSPHRDDRMPGQCRRHQFAGILPILFRGRSYHLRSSRSPDALLSGKGVLWQKTTRVDDLFLLTFQKKRGLATLFFLLDRRLRFHRHFLGRGNDFRRRKRVKGLLLPGNGRLEKGGIIYRSLVR